MSCQEYLYNLTLLHASVTKHQKSPQDYTAKLMEDYINKVAMPIISCFGIVGNIMNLIVLTRKQLKKTMESMEKSAHFGLVALATADLMFCIVILPRAFVPNNMVYTQDDSLLMLYYQAHNSTLINIFLLCSTWLTIVMAVERYLAICHPLEARRFISLKFTRTAVIVTFLLSLGFNLPPFWESQVLRSPCTPECTCFTIIPTDLGCNEAFTFTYKIVWATVGTFMPLIVLAFCNICLIRALHKSRRMRQHYGATQPADSGNHLTLTLVTIILLFILLVCPSEILQFVNISNYMFNQGKQVYNMYQSACIIANLALTLNFALNFILYCAINVHFRKTIRGLFVCQKSSPGELAKLTATHTSNIETEI